MSNDHAHPVFTGILDGVSGKHTAASNPVVGRRQSAEPGECEYCDSERRKGNPYFPPHDASSRCQSGKHDHCTCDTCF